jgi:hypothetical protein
MRTIAGALVVIAGAILWGSGAIAVTLARGSSDAVYGGWAIFAGVVLVLMGAGTLIYELLIRPMDRQSEKPPQA